MIKSIISDLGNVLIFFDNNIFLNKIAAYSSLSEENVKREILANLELSRSFDRGKVTPEEFYLEATHILGAKIEKNTFFSLYNDIFSHNMPNVELLKSLRQRYKLVLCSNTDVERFEFVKQKFPEILFFDKYVVSYEVGFMKPHPRIYEAALEEAGTRPEESVFIDDIEENTKAAEKLGLHTILLNPDTNLKQELLKFSVATHG
ncbi:MAG: HAD family phosphatase [Candidatus Aminicenantes bacterium]|nr:HAD family phosphatase [Candidatus Aminicenantes bacterium]